MTKTTTTDDVSSTRTALLDAAEDLFERHGIRGTSLRSITDRAKANIASVNYHFGSKKDLVREVIARRIDPLNEERLRLLDELEERGDFELEDVLFALIAPAVRHVDGYAGLRLLSRMHFEPDPEFFELVHQPFEEIQRRFFAAIHDLAPEISNLSLHWRMSFGIGAVAATIANLEKLRSGRIPLSKLPEGTTAPDELGLDHDNVIRQLVRFIAAGLRAEEVTP